MRTNITLEYSVGMWVHRVGQVSGELVYQSDECNVYLDKKCRCSKPKPSVIAYQACIAVQGIGLSCGKLRGVK